MKRSNYPVCTRGHIYTSTPLKGCSFCNELRRQKLARETGLNMDAIYKSRWWLERRA